MEDTIFFPSDLGLAGYSIRSIPICDSSKIINSSSRRIDLLSVYAKNYQSH